MELQPEGVRRRTSRWSRSTALLLAVSVGAAAYAPVQAQDKACVKSTGATWSLNGAVASGAVSSCTPNSAWTGVAPFTLEPKVSQGTIAFTYVPPVGQSPGNLFFGFTVPQDPNLSERDIVELIFDHDNDNTLNAGDFYVLIKVGPALPAPGPITTGTQCSFAVNSVEYYERVGNAWQIVDDAAVTGQITATAAYDYAAGPLPEDLETNLWNIEIRIPFNVPRFQLGTVAPFFGVGAYIYEDYNAGSNMAQTGQVLRWPAGLPTRTIGQSNLNSSPLASADAFADAQLTGSCFNVSFAGGGAIPWRINNAVPTPSTSDRRINRNGGNTFSVEFFYSGPGDSPGSGPNPGMVQLGLRPYYATGHGAEWVQSKPSAAPEFNKVYRVDFGDPVASYPSNVDFLCATMTLNGFAHDDITSDNSRNVNYNYIHTSSYTQPIDITAEGIAGLRPGDTTSVLLHFVSTNDPLATRVGMTGPRQWQWAAGVLVSSPPAPWLLGGVILLFLGALMWRRRVIAGVALLVGVLAVVQGCRKRPSDGGGGPVSGGRWQVENAAELGIRPVQGEPGWFRMPVRAGESRRLRLAFDGRPLPYAAETRRLAARDSLGRPTTMRVPVRAGQVATVLAFGSIDLDGPGPQRPTTATGFVRTEGGDRAAAGYRLSTARYRPEQYVGALIGSFDDFRTSFVIGTDASIVVPRGAEFLSLAINGRAADFAAALGDYEIKVILTPLPGVPTATRAGFDTPFDKPNFLALWDVLTSVSLYTFHEVERRGAGGQVESVTRDALGSAHTSIYESHGT